MNLLTRLISEENRQIIGCNCEGWWGKIISQDMEYLGSEATA